MEKWRDDVLTHHGILGQKWGIRNGPSYPLSKNQRSSLEKRKNGAISESGKERYGDDGVSSNSKSKSKSGNKIIDKSKMAKPNKSDRSARSPKELSDSELIEAINRANLEKTYKNLKAEEAFSVNTKNKQTEDLIKSGMNAFKKSAVLASKVSSLTDNKEATGKLSTIAAAGGFVGKIYSQTLNVRDQARASDIDKYKNSLEVSNMSNDELRQYINRRNLEKNYTSAVGDPNHSENLNNAKRKVDQYSNVVSIGTNIASLAALGKSKSSQKSSNTEKTSSNSSDFSESSESTIDPSRLLETTALTTTSNSEKTKHYEEVGKEYVDGILVGKAKFIK